MVENKKSYILAFFSLKLGARFKSYAHFTGRPHKRRSSQRNKLLIVCFIKPILNQEIA